MIDKTKVKRFFSKRASSYDQNAHLQARMGDELLHRLMRENDFTPQTIIDVGAGTGRLALHLTDTFPQATVICSDIAHGMTRTASTKALLSGRTLLPLTADAELLPLRNESVDLVVSNAAFQWLNDLRFMLREASRILKPGGEIWFTMLGHRTLWELRSSFRQIEEEIPASPRVHLVEFQSIDGICDAIDQESFQNYGIDVSTVVETYPSAWNLLKSLQSIGAQNASIQQDKGLGHRSHLERVIKRYEERFVAPGGISATFEIIFGHAKKIAAGPEGRMISLSPEIRMDIEELLNARRKF